MRTFTLQITEEDVEKYAYLSGDDNPIHLNVDIAKQAGFANKVVHGMLTIAKVISIISNDFLASNVFIQKSEFTFFSPIYIGSKISLTVKPTNQEIVVVGHSDKVVHFKGKIGILQELE